MENRVTVSICGIDYTFLSEENRSYMEKVAAFVDEKMAEIMSSGRLSQMDAAVLVAVNITDEMIKQQSNAENLRTQLKGYLDEAGKAQSQVSELKREIFKLQQQLQKAQSQKK